jgi:hypothetical protein
MIIRYIGFCQERYFNNIYLHTATAPAHITDDPRTDGLTGTSDKFTAISDLKSYEGRNGTNVRDISAGASLCFEKTAIETGMTTSQRRLKLGRSDGIDSILS